MPKPKPAAKKTKKSARKTRLLLAEKRYCWTVARCNWIEIPEKVCILRHLHRGPHRWTPSEFVIKAVREARRKP